MKMSEIDIIDAVAQSIYEADPDGGYVESDPTTHYHDLSAWPSCPAEIIRETWRCLAVAAIEKYRELQNANK